MMGSPGDENITVQCTCGAKLQARASAAGQRARCPKCSEILTIAAAPEPADAREAQPPFAKDAQRSIRVTCPCGAHLKLPASAAGRRARCPKCAAEVRIPRESTASSPPPATSNLRRPPPVADSIEFEELGRGPAVGTAPASEADSTYRLAAPIGGRARGGSAATAAVALQRGAETGKAQVCPSCHKSLPASAKICTDCGIYVKTGRPVLAVEDEHIDRVYETVESTVRWLSWLMWYGIYPVASEAFGLWKPWVIRGIAAFTILISAWYFVAVEYNPDPEPANLRLMLWTGSTNLQAADSAPVAAPKAQPEPNATLDPQLPPDKSLSADDIAKLTAALQTMPVAEFHWYQLFTHAVLHADILHLAGNLLFLLVFGSRVNALIGNVLTAILYPLLAVIAGVAELIAYAEGPPIPCLGASGAIMGLAGMYLVFFPVHKVHMAAWWRWGLRLGFELSFGIFAVRGFWVVLTYIGLEVLYTALRLENGVAHWAHLGGFIGGVVLGLLLLVCRAVDARGGDVFTALLGRWAWGLIGPPGAKRLSLP